MCNQALRRTECTHSNEMGSKLRKYYILTINLNLCKQCLNMLSFNIYHTMNIKDAGNLPMHVANGILSRIRWHSCRHIEVNLRGLQIEISSAISEGLAAVPGYDQNL